MPGVFSVLRNLQMQDHQSLFSIFIFCPVSRPAGCTRKMGVIGFISLSLAYNQAYAILQVCALLAAPLAFSGLGLALVRF